MEKFPVICCCLFCETTVYQQIVFVFLGTAKLQSIVYNSVKKIPVCIYGEILKIPTHDLCKKRE